MRPVLLFFNRQDLQLQVVVGRNLIAQGSAWVVKREVLASTLRVAVVAVLEAVGGGGFERLACGVAQAFVLVYQWQARIAVRRG